MSWDSYSLKDSLLRGIYNYGFETPSSIQQLSIPPFTQGLDLVAQAQSGTGKTGSFAIGCLQRIDESKSCLQAIVLEPTRELAVQSQTVIAALGSCMGIRTACFVGGTPMETDKRQLMSAAPPHVLVGTLGRIKHLITQCPRTVFEKVTVLVMDEADQLLADAVVAETQAINRLLPVQTQIVLFSATMNDQMHAMTPLFMRPDAVQIVVPPEQLNLECIKQYFSVVTNDDDKYRVLCLLYGRKTIGQSMIYCNSGNRAQHLADKLLQDRFSVGVIHGGLTKPEREEVMQKFRSGEYRVMVSSDITARGIDVQQVNLVVNYDLTHDVATYLHRIGRGGRWGRKGEAINLITRHDIAQMKAIETHYQSTIVEYPL
jgi:translation initiation factor 4A